jgi:phosphoribosylanthranilate isomerase
VADVKFCGLTRATDAALAGELGASYAGAIFAGGPRLLDVRRAREMFDGLGGAPTRRVGVFGAQSVDEILRIADGAALHVIQLHGGATADRLLVLQQRFAGEVWTVVAIGTEGPGDLSSLAGTADAVVLDSRVDGRSGGTGRRFDWRGSLGAVDAIRARVRIVLAGGLRPANVREAIEVLAPDVVDVSSGVEIAPGIKDPGLMRAFAESARPREE